MAKNILLILCVMLGLSSQLKAAEPTQAATNLKAGTITCNSAQLTWTSGNGAWRLVLVKEASAVDAVPADGSSYSANANFGSGGQLGTGNFAVFNNITNSEIGRAHV